MPHQDTITCQAGEWTQVTTQDVSAIRLQNQGSDTVHIVATPGPTPPTDRTGSIVLSAGDIIAAGLPINELFPAVTAGYRVWAWASIPVGISVSHV